jgi:competence protein ComZ
VRKIGNSPKRRFLPLGGIYLFPSEVAAGARKGAYIMNEDKTMQFMQLAMKYLPEAKQKFDEAGIEVSVELLQPFMSLFTKVMNEAYELGKQDALHNEE